MIIIQIRDFSVSFLSYNSHPEFCSTDLTALRWYYPAKYTKIHYSRMKLPANRILYGNMERKYLYFPFLQHCKDGVHVLNLSLITIEFSKILNMVYKPRWLGQHGIAYKKQTIHWLGMRQYTHIYIYIRTCAFVCVCRYRYIFSYLMAYHSIIIHASRKSRDAKVWKVCVTQHMNLAFQSYLLQCFQDVLGWNVQHLKPLHRLGLMSENCNSKPTDDDRMEKATSHTV